MANRLKSGKSKLSKIAPPNTTDTKTPPIEQTNPKLNIVKKRKKTTTARSYRLHEPDLVRLKDTVARLNEDNETGRVISETALIRGLILLADKTASSRLLKAIKDAM